MKSPAIALSSKSWVVAAAIASVAGAGTAKLVWPTVHHPQVKVLGEKTITTSSANGSGNGASNGNGNGGTTGNPGHPITLNTRVVGNLAPGVTVTVRVTVTNSNPQDLTLTGVTPTIGTPSNAGCANSWFTITGFSGAMTVAKNGGTATVDLPMSMLNKPFPQDACKTSNIPLSLAATAHS